MIFIQLPPCCLSSFLLSLQSSHHFSPSKFSNDKCLLFCLALVVVMPVTVFDHIYLMLYILYVSEHPELSYYADGNLVSEFTQVENLKTGTLNCTVLAHPMAEVTLWQDSKKIPATSACTPYSALLSSCSLSAPDFPVSKGFECKVKYNSPETGDLEEVIPDGCCAEPMYPANLPSGMFSWNVCSAGPCAQKRETKQLQKNLFAKTTLSLSLSLSLSLIFGFFRIQSYAKMAGLGFSTPLDCFLNCINPR